MYRAMSPSCAEIDDANSVGLGADSAAINRALMIAVDSPASRPADSPVDDKSGRPPSKITCSMVPLRDHMDDREIGHCEVAEYLEGAFARRCFSRLPTASAPVIAGRPPREIVSRTAGSIRDVLNLYQSI
jgi:hypothetical protein